MAYKDPFIDPRSHYAKLKPEIDGAIVECLANGDLVNRHQLKDFERHLAEFVGVNYVVGVNSGYHALLFALLGGDRCYPHAHRVEYLLVSRCAARGDEFIAAAQYRNARQSRNLHGRPACRCSESEGGSVKPIARTKQHLALLENDACIANVAAFLAARRGHKIAVAYRVLLDQNRIGPIGQRRAGEYSRALARAQRPR